MKTILYYRVSTVAQGRSGLGLEAQQAAVASFCQTRGCETLGTYTEIESGKNDVRPQLAAALHHAKITNATLVVAKLDRLSRNIGFIAALQDAKVKFVACDMPEANEVTIGIMAVMAQAERKAISTRTCEALQAAKARGVRLGNPNGAAALLRGYTGNGKAVAKIKANADAFALDLASTIADIVAGDCISQRAIADELNRREIKTPRGGVWHAGSVRLLMQRLAVP